MAVTQLTCPECSATLRLKEEVPDGKRVRCPKCKTTFLPSDEAGDNDVPPVPVRRQAAARDDDNGMSDRPRTGKKKRSKKKKTNPALIIVPIAIAVVLLLGGTAAAIYFLSGNKDDPKTKTVAGTQVNKAGPSSNQPPPNTSAGLAVGNVAMEIDGEDIDGKPFKLSDYRGKVVVLDFWGNW
jgi:predicted Zn finger-like uncharacterized protein